MSTSVHHRSSRLDRCLLRRCRRQRCSGCYYFLESEKRDAKNSSVTTATKNEAKKSYGKLSLYVRVTDTDNNVMHVLEISEQIVGERDL